MMMDVIKEKKKNLAVECVKDLYMIDRSAN